MPERVDGFLRTYFIDPVTLRIDDFRAMMTARSKVLCAEIAEVTGIPVSGLAIDELFNGVNRFDANSDEPDE
jgi:hypothetical protein